MADDGARELLRERYGKLVRHGEASVPAQTKQVASEALLDAVIDLFEKYNFKVLKRKTDRVKYWAIIINYGEEAVELFIDHNGEIGAQIGRNGHYKRPASFTPTLIWDPDVGGWFGPLLDVRDLSRPGAPRLRIEASEEVTRALLDAIQEAQEHQR